MHLATCCWVEKSKHTYLDSSDEEEGAVPAGPVCASEEEGEVEVDPVVEKHITELNPSQTKAVLSCVGSHGLSHSPNPLVLLQGPPGTGKTKTIVSLLRILFEQTPRTRVAVCAPTNKAVQVMAMLVDALQQSKQAFSPLI